MPLALVLDTPWALAYCLNGSSAALIAYSPATIIIYRLSSRHRWTFSSASSYYTCPLVLSSKYHSVAPHFRGRGTKRQELHVIMQPYTAVNWKGWEQGHEAMIVEKTLIRIPRSGWLILPAGSWSAVPAALFTVTRIAQMAHGSDGGHRKD